MAGKVLIAEGVATNRIVLKARLADACYRPLMAGTGEACLDIALRDLPDLILLDLALPGRPALEVLAALRADRRLADVPVIAIAASGDTATRLAALAGGADDVLAKPVDEPLLMARLRNLMRNRDALAEMAERGATMREIGLAEAAAPFDLPGRIALVCDRAETAMRWRKQLAAALRDDIVPLSRAEALTDNADADVFVIESDPDAAGGGLRLMSELRSRPATRHAAVMLLAADAAPEQVALAYDVGANDVQPSGIDGRELGLRVGRLLAQKRQADRLRASVNDGLRMAVIDPLTGLYNRRYAEPRLARIAERAIATGQTFAVLVMDLDLFKSVNDRWGHAAGDAVLVEVARRLCDNLRGSDLLARTGGEEFLVVLPDISRAEAQAAAERLRAAVNCRPVRLPGGQAVPVTVSIGMALADGGRLPRSLPVAEIVHQADHALLAAKAGGRDCVRFSLTAA